MPWLLLLWSSVSLAEAPARCVQADDASVVTAKAEAERVNAAALEQALAAKHLKRVTLPLKMEVVGRGADASPSTQDKPPPGGKYVRAESYWSLSGRGTTTWEFVEDEKGHVFRLLNPADPITTNEILVCGCQPRDCTYGSGCPACGNTLQLWYGPLPKGKRYAGELPVKQPYQMVELRWEKGMCSEECPPPPPSTNNSPAPPPRPE